MGQNDVSSIAAGCLFVAECVWGYSNCILLQVLHIRVFVFFSLAISTMPADNIPVGSAKMPIPIKDKNDPNTRPNGVIG